MEEVRKLIVKAGVVVDGIDALNATITIGTLATDSTTTSNPRLEPLTILSTGPIRLDHSTIDVSASGLNGGPGGGGVAIFRSHSYS
mgnify:CR=1 FL=1